MYVNCLYFIFNMCLDLCILFLKQISMAFQEFNHTGYWGNPTATIDWCEKNYEVNYYVAELCE